MDIEKQLLEVYDVLQSSGLQSFFSSLYFQLDIRKKADLLQLTQIDLFQIGIVSTICIKRFEKVLENVRALKESQPKKSEAFTVDYILIDQDPVIISSNDVKYEEALGAGHFGKVYKALWDRKNHSAKVPVAIKTLTDGFEMSWKKEVAIFTALNQNHPNIIRFFGLLISNDDQVKMVTEFAVFGSLLDLLRAKRITSISTLSQFAVQIASGMVFLHSKNLVHRDLSARNILVTGDYQVKISDFGLSKILGETEQEWVMDSNEKLPMRWLAPESFNSGVFTTASDVWSFAVVLWEMFTFGDLPWGDYNNEEVKGKIENGVMLPEPRVCPSGIYEVMEMCFEIEADERPPFHVIKNELINRQPETVLTISSETHYHFLNHGENEYVTAIKEIKDDCWLGQHENTLLFGCFKLSSTTSVDYTMPLEKSDVVRVDEFSHIDGNKENLNLPEAEPYYQTPRAFKTHIDTGEETKPDKISDCPLYESIPSVNVGQPNKKTDQNEKTPNLEKTRPHSAVVLTGRQPVQHFLEISTLKSDSDSKIRFKETSPVVQETVNDRITYHLKEFMNLSEKKLDDIKLISQSDYLVPVDVSVKPSIDSVIQDVDPYPRLKAASQSNIYEQPSPHVLSRKSQSTDGLQAKSERPRPKPKRHSDNKKLSDAAGLDRYAESIKKDFLKFASGLDQTNMSKAHSSQLSSNKVSTGQLDRHRVKNHEYLTKYSHVILPSNSSVSHTTPHVLSTHPIRINGAYEHDINSTDTTDYASYVAGKQMKRFSYDATTSNDNLINLPMSAKERSQRAVTNYTRNDWHLFEECVKDPKKIEKAKKNGAHDISWPRDMSKLSQEKKEEFSNKFKRIRALLPDASVSDCLDGLRYSDDNVHRTVIYIQVVKLARHNFGFSFQQCEKIFHDNGDNYTQAEQALKTKYVLTQFKHLELMQVTDLLSTFNWNVAETLTAAFVQCCRDSYGVPVGKAQNILEETDHNVLKAFEMVKIIRLSEITGKAEHLCFRALTHCRWNIERAVDYLFTN